MGLVVDTMADIGVTRISRWIFNCYVIHDGGAGMPVVVDAGLPGVTDDVLEVMTGLGLDLAALAGVYATHAHSDHVGGAPLLSARAGAPVYLPHRSRDYLQGERPRTPGLASIARIWPTAFDQPFDRRGATGAIRGSRIAGYGTGPGMRWPATSRPGFLPDDGSLPEAPEWQVIAAPGHTDDSVALFNPRTRTLLSGDAVLSIGGRAWMTPETVDEATGAETSGRLRALDVAHLLPGHGRPVHGDGATARALGPHEGPRGAAAFSSGLVRCLTGGAEAEQ